MIITGKNVVCTGKPEPNHWEMGDRSGVSYKVEVSDGSGNIKLQCATEEVYNVFQAFKTFNVDFELIGTNYEGRSGVKCMIVNAKAANA